MLSSTSISSPRSAGAKRIALRWISRLVSGLLEDVERRSRRNREMTTLVNLLREKMKKGEGSLREENDRATYAFPMEMKVHCEAE